MRSRLHRRVLVRLSAALALSSTVAFAEAADEQPMKAAAQRQAAPRSGAQTTVEGRILGLEQKRLVIDVGARLGAAPGDTGELWRPVEMRHPVTKRPVTDRYRIGSIRVTEALEVMSFVELDGEPRQKPRVGDIIVMRVVRPEAPAKTESTKPAVAATDPDGEAVAALVESLRGSDLAVRVSKMDAWLRANPRNRHAAPLREELALLKRLAPSGEGSAPVNTGGVAPPAITPPSEAAPSEAPPQSVGIPAYQEPRVERFAPPESAYSGVALEIGVEISGSANGVILQSRNAGEVRYASTVMRSEGRDFWVASVDARRLQAPTLDYFIEIVRLDGVAVPAVGSPDSPLHIVVKDAPKPAAPPRHRSTASAYTDYADYNRLRGNDRAWQTEGFLGMRFADVGLRALRTGFGVYRGVGGSVADLDVLGLAPRQVGLTYGYLEGEAGFSPTISVIGRAAVGLRDSGVSGGGQIHLRIGSDLDTNLLLGGELLGGIGVRGITEFQILPQGRFPFTTRVEVTNQPGGERDPSAAYFGESPNRSEVAGRLIVQPGFRVLPPLVVFLRFSGQGRTIDHFGPGFGGGATFEW